MPATAITTHILGSLRKPSAYPVKTVAIELIQTHISWLLLTDSHVFKIKKPVNFGFLDFSTLELRRFYCHEELRLNRRLCPDMYEQVIALREAGDGVGFIGNGKVIDYAVMMKRLPSDRMLDRLVDNGAVSVADIQLVARKISGFHAEAATSPHIAEFGSLEHILFNWRENLEQVLPFQNSTIPMSVRENIRSYVEAFAETNRALFEERVEQGYIRDCDGDIHLGNICLVNPTVYIFDCIEFNERFRYSDTAADIAFLLMDLDFHHRPDLAEAALSAYIKSSGDTNLAELVIFYKVYRAVVRGKVENLLLLDPGITAEAHAAAEACATSYFRLAQGYSLRSRLPPTLMITCGTTGCGKSTLAEMLAFELGLALFNSDTVRKQLAGVATTSAVYDPFGEGLYSEEMTHRTYGQLERLAAADLAAGHSVLVDAGFRTAAERNVFAGLAAAHNARFIILSVKCLPDLQRQRLRKRTARGDSVSDGREELLDQQTAFFAPPDDSEGAVITLYTNGTPEQALNTLYERLFSS